MLEIRPFRGLRYNPKLVEDLNEVVCPPYDIISSEEQQSYLRRSPYNVIRLELAEELLSDTTGNNKYTRSAALLRKWIADRILVVEDKPAFYVTESCFSHRGQMCRRWGLTAAVGIEDWSSRKVRPHEAILKEPASDRLSLLRACQVNFSSVVSMLNFERGELAALLSRVVSEAQPLSVTQQGVTDKLWVLQDEEKVQRLRALCEGKILYILDGHHRYQTALTYKAERGEGRGADYVMMNIVDASDPGLLLLPTHRLVHAPADGLRGLRERLGKLLGVERMPRTGSTIEETVETWTRAMEEMDRDEWAVGAYGLWGGDMGLLHARRETPPMNLMQSEDCGACKQLDVSMLHSTVLERGLGMDAQAADRGLLEFTRDPVEAIRRVDSGEFSLAFILKAIPTSAVIAVADAADRMPHKSTYLYPKPRTGLVMNPLWD